MLSAVRWVSLPASPSPVTIGEVLAITPRSGITHLIVSITRPSPSITKRNRGSSILPRCITSDMEATGSTTTRMAMKTLAVMAMSAIGTRDPIITRIELQRQPVEAPDRSAFQTIRREGRSSPAPWRRETPKQITNGGHQRWSALMMALAFHGLRRCRIGLQGKQDGRFGANLCGKKGSCGN